MAFDLPNWLKQDLKLSDEAVAAVAAHLPADEVEKAVLRQSDYSKKMNEMKAQVTADQTALQGAREAFDAEIAEWGRVQGGTKAEQDRVAKAYVKAQQDYIAVTNALRTHAAQYGLDGEALINAALGTAGTVAPPAPPTPPNGLPADFDPKQFVSRQAVGQLSNLAVMSPATILKLQRQYKKLTGGEEFDEEDLAKELLRRAHDPKNTKSLEMVDVYNELFDVPSKTAAAEQARIDGLVKDAEARGRQAALTEASIPGGGQPMLPGRHSPIFSREHTPAMQRPAGQNPTATNTNAVNALTSGKYRTPDPATAGR